MNMKVKKQKHSLSTKVIFTFGVAVILLMLGLIVSNMPPKGYMSKAAEEKVNCKQLCDTKLPNHMKYTLDCAAKIQAGSTEPCGCEKACIKVVEGIQKENLTCETSCDTKLRPARAGICKQLLCPILQGAKPQEPQPQ